MRRTGLILVVSVVLSCATDARACGRDGDTFTFDGRCIRLFGIDAPELAQPFGRESAAWLQALVPRVTSCTRWYTDRYGREVARCRLADGTARGTDLGLTLVQGGYAWDYPQYSGEYYAFVQADARRNRRGLWALPSPQPPWEYRKRMQETHK